MLCCLFRRKATPATRQGMQTSLGIHRQDLEDYNSLLLTDLRRQLIKLDLTTWDASSYPPPNGTRKLMLGHDRVGAGLMTDLGYVPEQLATQCKRACALADLPLQW